jgi:predicted transcriptional regulator YdeE
LGINLVAVRDRKKCPYTVPRIGRSPTFLERFMRFIAQPQALHVVGIALRTHNGEAFQTIPPLWGRFAQSGLADRLPHRLSDDVHAVYTHFENAGVDNSGWYTLVIGHAVPGDTPTLPPEDLTHVVAPASLRAVFEVAQGRPDLVGAEWQQIWQRTDLQKTTLADYERYQPDGTIGIHIGVSESTP